VLLANMLSICLEPVLREQHYSAPLVPAFVIAAIYGAQRWALGPSGAYPGEKSRASRRYMDCCCHRRLATGLVVGVSGQNGWTPLGRNFSWPQVTAHARLLERFVTQIPPDAAVSATPPLHPHRSHRRVIYQFPSEVARI
jgi:hypothetical protein